MLVTVFMKLVPEPFLNLEWTLIIWNLGNPLDLGEDTRADTLMCQDIPRWPLAWKKTSLGVNPQKSETRGERRAETQDLQVSAKRPVRIACGLVYLRSLSVDTGNDHHTIDA